MSLNEMKNLIARLNEASRAYYNEDWQIMADFEYDKLYDRLVELESELGTVLNSSPTRKVGYEVYGSLAKVAHTSKILSLDKTKETEKLRSFLNGQKGILSWKLDGLTVVLTYEDGRLLQAVTRGNGEIGEDITHNAKVFKNLPERINFSKRLVIRGEALILYSDFEKINSGLKAGEEVYKNPRNLTSGTVRQLNSEITAGRNVMFYGFTVVNTTDTEIADELADSKEGALIFLSRLGFDVVEYEIVTEDTVEEAVERFKERIESTDFGSDGLVLTYDGIAYSMSLGATSKFPKDSIAFKWRDAIEETVLLDVLWNTSRTGLINPIAVFEPVDIEGSRISRASVHNLSIMEELELGYNDIITVYKANMIIPQIAENMTRSGTVKPPVACGVCGKETEVRQLREGKALYCGNPNCKAQLVKSLTHFVSRDAMNIEGLSEATIEKFVEQGFITDYTDIFALSRYEDEIKRMEGFGEKSYANLIQSIESSKDAELANFIYALGINQVGLRNARLLTACFDADISRIKHAAEEELLTIEGYGEIIAGAIVRYFSDEKNLALLNKALGYIRFKKTEEAATPKTLAGNIYVITGELNLYKNRGELQKEIEARGGKVTGTVTAKTTYLINNDVDSTSSKNKTAKKLGIPIITEEEFTKNL